MSLTKLLKPVDKKWLQKLLGEKNETVSISIPFNNSSVELLLVRANVLAEGFQTFTSDNETTPAEMSGSLLPRDHSRRA